MDLVSDEAGSEGVASGALNRTGLACCPNFAPAGPYAHTITYCGACVAFGQGFEGCLPSQQPQQLSRTDFVSRAGVVGHARRLMVRVQFRPIFIAGVACNPNPEIAQNLARCAARVLYVAPGQTQCACRQ